MAGSITVSSITLDSDNNFSIRSNTGATILSANGTGLITGIASGSAITNAQLTTPTVSGNLNFDSTGTSGVRLPAANTLTFHTSGTEDMRIDSSGNMGIGTTSPTAKLEVIGSSEAATSIFRVGANGNGGIVWRSANNTSVGYVQVNSDQVHYASTNDGTGAYLQKSGITFPATQSASSNANTLDDYEEGTWTPSVGGNATYQSQVGQYVKIGRFVCASFDMIINQIGTGSINSIGGLPFAAGGSVQGQSGSVGFFSGLSQGIHYLAIRLDLGSVDIAIAATNQPQTTITAGLGIFTSSSRLVGTIYYQVS